MRLWLRNIRLKAAMLAFALCALSANSATAGTPITSSFTVTATVLTTCLIVSLPLAFGNYDPTASSPTTGQTTITATCTLSAPYTIALNNGTGTGANYTTGASGRQMTLIAGSSTIGYNLYQDSAYANVWGNASTALFSGTGTGLPQFYTVYGRIPAQQVAGAGAYLDTITATLTF